MVFLSKHVEVTSVPQEMTGEEVVISGISGLFPSSDNVKQFMENLYNNVDMVIENPSKPLHPETPKHMGKISGINKFDAQFFRVHYHQVVSMEPMCRLLMEQAYCAMYDAGINPLSKKGEKIGVFFGSLYTDFSCIGMSTMSRVNDYYMSGTARCMFTNRVSYWLDSKGISCCLDANCSGSLICLANAYHCIKTGICNSAIIGGSELCAHDGISLTLRRAGVLCGDGKTKCFDKNGDGFVRSEAVSVLFLQKAKDAKRIYAEVKHASYGYGLKPDAAFLELRKPEEMKDFFNEFYSEVNVSPKEVEYVEAHGSAFPEADANELEAIGQVFANKKPVMVGCVKSNIGNTEPASGACGLTKLCLAYHKGKLPGNLHINDPLDIPVIKEGKVKVLTEATPFNRGYTAINNFSHTGNNCHALLQGCYITRDKNLYECNIPRVVLVSAREDKGINKIFDILKSQPINPELIGLLHNIYEVETPGHTSRGYIVLDTDSSKNEAISLSESAEYYQGTERPLWFLYSGMGSQWVGMGTQLLRLPVFASAIEMCRKALEPKGVDIVRILTDPDETIFDLILNSFVGIAAMQIGLTDVLKQMGIVPDYFIGHSLGEMGCAYADGCFSAEDMILAAYTRGLISIETEFIRGSMAAVGLGYKDMLPLCPPEIVIACHNSPQSCTLSGPAEIMIKFIAELTEKGIFAKEVPCGNIAYHSKYVSQAGPELLSTLEYINIRTVQRSKKWICTSYPEEMHDQPVAQFSSPEYHTNNFLNTVYFEEAAKRIPKNAVIIEIAPHCLFQSILKRSHPECTYIPLTRRFHQSPLTFFFEAVGKLYEEGFNPKVSALYPKIEFPVSTETPLLSHFVEWYHEDDWSINYETRKKKVVTPIRRFPMSLQDRHYKFIAGHIREGNVVFPEAAVLFILWETLSMYKEDKYENMPVLFHDVRFHGEVAIEPEGTEQYVFSVNKGNNYFEVTHEEFLIASGYIYIEEESSSFHPLTEENNSNEDIFMTSDDIYTILHLKGCFYEGEFKSIFSSSSKWNTAEINWTGNWITFLDGLMQLNYLARNDNGVTIPKFIRYLKIDPVHHAKVATPEINTVTAILDLHCGITQCGGVEIRGMILDSKKPTQKMPDIMKAQRFVPNKTINIDNEHKLATVSTNFALSNIDAGVVESVKWVDIEPQMKNNLIRVCFSGPTMRDIEKILGKVEYENEGYGMDFSGINNNGERVMGLVETGTLSTVIESNIDFLWPIPKYWSLEEAATVPLPYVYAYYCLFIRGDLSPGKSVLITNGSDALGHAIISICLAHQCKVYTSVDDLHKKQVLLKLFPALDENNIGYPHTDSYYIDCLCNKKFCDLVINCNTGQLREWAMKCVGYIGTFLDISVHDMKSNKDFGFNFVLGCRTYKSVILSTIFQPDKIDERKILNNFISDGIKTGVVKPISYVTYNAEDVSRAFRMLSYNKYNGRILVDLQSFGTLTNAFSVIPSMTYSSTASYIIVCDDLKLGVKLADQLIKHGVRKLIINFQTQVIARGYLDMKLSQWYEHGAKVTISTDNLQSRSSCLDFFNYNNQCEVYGIFIINMNLQQNHQTENFNSVIANLDIMSREICAELKHFVIITSVLQNVSPFYKKIVEMRADIGLPAIVFCAELFTTKNINQNSEIQPIAIEAALNALEVSLKQKYNHVLTYNVKNTDNSEFLSKIAAGIGIKNIDDVNEDLTIKQFGLNVNNIEELIFLIRKYCRLYYSADYVTNMTIGSLKNLSHTKSKQNTNFDGGFGVFYKSIEKDEVDATEIIVPMPSILNNFWEDELDLDENETYLMLIPGFEGHYLTFQTLCEKLKMNSITFPLGLDLSNDSIQKIALGIVKIMKKRLNMKSKFYLLGYSFGVNVALEIAALLEKDGLVGVVYCLDSSPDALKIQLDAYLGRLTEQQLQNAILEQIYFVISGQTNEEFKMEIERAYNWPDKVAFFVKSLMKVVTNTSQYLHTVAELAYERIRLAKEYVPCYKLESELVLLKGLPHPKSIHMADDYNLSKYTTKPVKIYDITSDMACAPYDCRVPNILNQLLDAELLDHWKTKNLCEVYTS